MRQIWEAIKNCFGLIFLAIYSFVVTLIIYWPIMAMMCAFAFILALINPLTGIVFILLFFIFFVIWFIVQLTKY